MVRTAAGRRCGIPTHVCTLYATSKGTTFVGIDQPGPLGRRSFLRGSSLVALAVLGVGAAPALVACSSAVGDQQSTASGGEPVRGGTLNTAIQLDIVPANILTNTAGAVALVGLVYDSLIRYPTGADSSIDPQPHLATSWELASDGLTLTLDLRDDVTFHSGRPFTSADAEFSLRTYGDPRWTAQLQSTAAAITAYDTSDPHRLVLTFAHPLGNIFDLLDTVPVIDSESFEQFAAGEAYIGTGPFVLTERVPNSSLNFERNDSYWIADRPYLDAVRTSIIPDAQARVNALRSGQVLATTNLAYRDAETLGASDGYSNVDLEGAELQIYVGANVENPALADPRLRQAIAYALDRERVIDEVFRGAGYPINLPWPKSSPAYDESRNSTYGFDTERARGLVDEIGAPAALPLTFQAGVPYYEATAQIIQSNLADAGIEVTLDPVEASNFVKQLIGQQFPGLWVTFHSWAQYTPSTLTVSAYPFNAARNASRFNSPSYLDAATAAWEVPDGRSEEAIERYGRVGDELLEAVFLIEIGVVFNQLTTSAQVQDIGWTKRSEWLLTEAYLA